MTLLDAAVSATAPGKVRIGIDVGGTFIDCVLIDERSDRVELTKVPSNTDKGASVLHGISVLLHEANSSPADVGYLGHGTTLATNIIVSRTGDRVGVLVTSGFRDVLFLGRARFPEPTNLNGDLPSHLVARRDVYEVRERLSAGGEIVTPLEIDDVREALDAMVTEGITTVAVCFMHSTRNSVHERAVREEIERHYPDLFVSYSAEVNPRPREYERFLATVMNAFAGSKVKSYLSDVAVGAAAMGITPQMLVTRANGGIMNAEVAGAYPVHTMLSGPAAGVVAALYFAEEAGFPEIVTWDMGGTSLDVSILDGRLRYTENARIGAYPLFVPTVDVVSVGAGGGSIAWVDAGGLLHVGPRSAGAMPGPACYGRGGTEATLTDAYVALGIIDASRFAGAELSLNRELAIESLTKLGNQLGVDPLAAAEAVLTVATAQMIAEFMPTFARYGVPLDETPLFPYGGGGPVHAFIFAKAAGFRRVVVPRFPGLLCAWGTVIADVRYEVPRAIGRQLVAISEDEINGTFDELGVEASTWLADQKVAIESRGMLRLANMRYRGQSFDLEVVLPADKVTHQDMRDRFLSAHIERYGYADDSGEIEIVSITAQIVGNTDKPKTALAAASAPHKEPVQRSRQIYIDGAWRTVPAFDRSALQPYLILYGPLVVDQPDTTVFVPTGFSVWADEHGNLIGEAS